MRALLCLTLLLAADSWTLRYRFPRDLSYEETTTRSFRLQGKPDGKPMLYDISSEETLRRTILEADADERPLAEKVEVVRFSRTVAASPDEEPGTRSEPCEGKTFVWRRLEERWGLFDGKEADVTADHPKLVERLKCWRDARVPKAAVAKGAKWDVPADAYLTTAGQPVPPGIEGVAAFTLDTIEGGVAGISFVFEGTVRVKGTRQRWSQQGLFRFDVEKGRELEYASEGTIEIDGGGSGASKQKRVVTYR
jgi:hypothetical protein